MPFRSITITDATESVVLEEIRNLDQIRSFVQHYEDNQNVKNLKGVYEGRVQDQANIFQEKTCPVVVLENRGEVANGFNAGVQGGASTIFYQSGMNSEGTLQTSQTAFDSKPAQLIWRFNLSGILGDHAEKVFPVIACGGMVVRLELLEADRYLVPLAPSKPLTGAIASTLMTPAGYGRLRSDVGTIASAGGTNVDTATVVVQDTNENDTCYGIVGIKLSAGGANVLLTTTPWTSGNTIDQLVLNHASADNNLGATSIVTGKQVGLWYLHSSKE